MSKEIVKACVKYNDRFYTGFEHGECFNKLNEDNTIIVFDKIEQGFIDNEINFVDRKQAMIIAKENGQLSYETNKKTLISEDLYLDWLKKQDQKIKELEHRLSNCIEPKFKIGQEVWFVNKRNGYDAKVECAKIENVRIFALKSKIQINYRISDSNCSWYDRHSYRQKELFTTEEEAKKHLEELKNG